MLPSDESRGWLHGIKYEDWALDLHSRLVWSLLISFDPHIFYTWYQVEYLWTRGDHSGLLIDTKVDTIINKPIHQTFLSVAACGVVIVKVIFDYGLVDFTLKFECQLLGWFPTMKGGWEIARE